MDAEPATVGVITKDIWCGVLGDTVVPLLTRFGYTREDPWGIWITFACESGQVIWCISRDLLIEGSTRLAGEGDVRIWPLELDTQRLLCMELSNPSGRASIQFPRQQVINFLSRSLGSVPVGTEQEHWDVDAVIASLLS